MDSRAATEYIKGIVIGVVMMAHYASYYYFDVYNRWLFEYASEAVSVFFILSGYGLYYSLDRRRARTAATRRLTDFYFRRALRIYPLYWLSLFITPLLLPGYGYEMLHEPSLHTLGIYLAFPLVVAPGVYWFIPALMQCYLVAPLCFRLLKRLGTGRYLLLAATGTALCFPGTYFVHSLAGRLHIDPQALLYRNFLFANILLFALGMAAPVMVERYRREPASYVWLAASLVLFLTAAYITRFPDLLFARSNLYFTPLFLWSAALFCFFMIAAAPPLPFGRGIAFAGRYSYPLFLFHRAAFGFLFLIGVIEVDSGVSLVATVLLMPLIMAACYLLERLSRETSSRVERFLATGQPGPPATPAQGAPFLWQSR